MQRTHLLVIALVLALVGYLCLTQFGTVPSSSQVGNSAPDPETGGATADNQVTEAVQRSLVVESAAMETFVLRVVL